MDLDGINASWYLAQLKPNSHRIAERNLRRQGFTTFLPLHERTKSVRSTFQTTLEPLFPGYIFIALDPARGGWQSINATFGVTRMVSFGSAPASVPTELVVQLRQRFGEDGVPRKVQDLQPGDIIRLISGPFADFVTTVEEIAPDKRVWLLIDLMGRPTRVAVDVGTLQRA